MGKGLEFRVSGLESRMYGAQCRVYVCDERDGDCGLSFKVKVLGFTVYGLRLTLQGWGVRVYNCEVSGAGCTFATSETEMTLSAEARGDECVTVAPSNCLGFNVLGLWFGVHPLLPVRLTDSLDPPGRGRFWD